MKLSTLISYWGCNKKSILDLYNICKAEGVEFQLFIDSGAYSASTVGAAISIDQYMHFIRDLIWLKPIYANMDVIGDYQASAENQRIMESWGLNPIPVYHGGSPIREFERLHEAYEYIAVGGLVGENPNTKIGFFKHLADILNKKGYRKIHMFGVTPHLKLFCYPWYSFDSTVGNINITRGLRSYLPQQLSHIITVNNFKLLKEQVELLREPLEIVGININDIFKRGRVNHKLANTVQIIVLNNMVRQIGKIVEAEVVFYHVGIFANMVNVPAICRYLKTCGAEQ